MDAESLSRFGDLQSAVRKLGGREQLTAAERAELERLERELAMAPEVADDKSTPFIDESRRPQLDGTDWNDFNNAMCREEAKQMGLKYGLPLVKLAVESLLLKG